MAPQALRGTTDLLADALTRWHAIEHTARRVVRLYGYQEIRTPFIEDASLFRRTVGETTDIVQKEMFAFEDRGGRTIVLRPEGTAPIVRAYLEHHLDKTVGFARLFYLGAMFRAERPQAGRFRQFHQLGVEAIGSYSPWVDAEVIALCVHLLTACGVKGLSVWLSSMGCRKDQARSAVQLRKRLAPHKGKFCADCQSRFDKNIFRVLDCKRPACRELAWAGGQSPFELCDDCRRHFDQVREALRGAGVAFDDTKVFARGLDYYTRTVFEIRAAGLGAQDAVAAGGRYDQLVEEMGGPALGAIGFAVGIERLLMATESPGSVPLPAADRGGTYVAMTQPTLVAEGFQLAQRLRQRGIETVLDCDGRSLKAQFREADKSHCRWVAVLGEAEVRKRSVTVKDLEQGGQREVAIEAFVEELAQHAKAACH